MDKPIRVLLVEDDPEDYKIFHSYLKTIKRSEFEIDRVSRYENSLEAMLKKGHDIYLLDYYLGQNNGLELLKEALSRGFDLPVIFLTGRKNSNTDLEALKYGAYDYLVKEYVNPENLERSIRYALSRFDLERKLKEQTIILKTIIESSPVGMCVISEDMKFTHWNSQFTSMFGLNELDIDRKMDECISFDRKIEDLYSKEFSPTRSPFALSLPNKVISFEGKVKSASKELYCVVKFKTIVINGNNNAKYKIFSFIDTERYKDRENQLREAVSKAENIVKKYAEDKKDPKAYMDLADLEVDKMKQSMRAESIGAV